MSISIRLWRVNLSVMGTVSSIVRLLKGARCPTVRWFMVFLTLTYYSFKDNKLIIGSKKLLSDKAGITFNQSIALVKSSNIAGF